MHTPRESARHGDFPGDSPGDSIHRAFLCLRSNLRVRSEGDGNEAIGLELRFRAVLRAGLVPDAPDAGARLLYEVDAMEEVGDECISPDALAPEVSQGQTLGQATGAGHLNSVPAAGSPFSASSVTRVTRSPRWRERRPSALCSRSTLTKLSNELLHHRRGHARLFREALRLKPLCGSIASGNGCRTSVVSPCLRRRRSCETFCHETGRRGSTYSLEDVLAHSGVIVRQDE